MTKSILLLLSIVVAVALAQCERSDIIRYLSLLDTDGNGNLTAAEIDTYHDVCGNDPTEVIGADIVTACDVNGDGVLNEAFDYDGDMSCMSIDAVPFYVCLKGSMCEQHIADMASYDEGDKKKRMAMMNVDHLKAQLKALVLKRNAMKHQHK